LSHLFSTNAPVPPEERSVLMKEIEVIDQTIDELRQRLDALERDRRDCLALLSPLRTIPSEVLAKVFASTVDPRQIEQNGDVRKQVIDFCLVCKAWRQSAISAHQLWTTLAIMTPFTPRDYEKAERWFGRAGVLPKRMALSSPEDDCPVAQVCALTASNQALARFLVEGPVLDNLSISCTRASCLSRLLSEMWGLAPGTSHWSWGSIRCLRLDITSDWSEIDTIRNGPGSIENIFAQLPLAPSFHLSLPSRYDGNEEHRMPSVPATFLSQLTTFTLSCDWNAVEILKLLHSCNQASDLRETPVIPLADIVSEQVLTLTLDFKENPLEFDQTAWLEINTKDRIVLPGLSTLRLVRLHPGAFKHIAPYIKAPRLLELDVSFAVNWGMFFLGDSTLRDLGELLVASSCNTRLRHIGLHDVNIGFESMTSFLEETDLASLERLTLDKVGMPASVFTYLLTHMDSLPFSRLQTIELVNMAERSLIALAMTYAQARRDMDDRSETRLIISHSS